jgi:hypothetical protein
MNVLAWVLQAVLAFCYLLYSIVLVIPPGHMKRMFADIPFSLRVVVAVFAAVASLLLVLPVVVKSLMRMILPASVVLMIIAGSEALFMLARHQSSVARVRGVLFVMALVLVLIRWRMAPRSGSAPQFASRA